MNICTFQGGEVWGRGLSSPQIIVINLCLSPLNTPFLLPGSIIDDEVIMRQLLHFRIKIKSFLGF